MTPLLAGILLAGGLASVVCLVLGTRDQRDLWWRQQAHRYADPDAVEPSAEEFTRRRTALVLLGTGGVLACAVTGLTAVVRDVDRQSRTDAALVALVRAVEAEPLPVGCPTGVAARLGCEQPRDAVADRAGQLTRVTDQHVVVPGQRFRLDLDLLPDGVPRCLDVAVTDPLEERVRPGGPEQVGGRRVDVPDVELGAEATVAAAVLDGACGG